MNFKPVGFLGLHEIDIKYKTIKPVYQHKLSNYVFLISFQESYKSLLLRNSMNNTKGIIFS